jgi:nicotinamidase-related amidase
MNIALLVIDMQKAFFYGSAKQSMENAAKYVNYIVDLFRNKNKKIGR